MGILDDVVINAKSAAEAVGKKASQFMDASKLRISAAELSAGISKQYEALGQLVFEAYRDKLAGEEELSVILSEIDELQAQHAAVTKELNDKQNKVVCPTCGKRSPNTVQYCSNCGTKLTVEEPEAPAEEPTEPEE